MNNIFLVYVDCPTFNHAPYIKDAMDGFCSQQTNFPFVCGIVDDSSTDGEQEVISNYLNEYFNLDDENVTSKEETQDYTRIFVQHKFNKHCYFLVFFLKYNHYSLKKSRFSYVSEWKNKSNYIAICEGDDYWTDSLKLKKQVDCMELFPMVGMCYTKCRYYYQDKGMFASDPWGGDAEKFETMIQSNPVPTASAMYRQGLHELYDDDVNPREKGWMLGDYPFWIWISKEYEVKFINEETCTYRVLEKSASHRDDRSMREAFIISVCSLQRFFADKYNQSELISIDKADKALLMDAYSNKDYEAVVHYYSQITNPGWRDVIKYIISKMVLLIK